MGTVNINLSSDTQLNMILGQQDETEVREVVFDFSGWYTTYGSGTISLSVQRSKDQWPYEVELTVDNTNHTATWTITDTDTGYAGVGMVQITYTVGTAKKKSVVYRFTVYRSLGATGNVITPVQLQTWMDEVDQELADVKQDFNKAINFSRINAVDSNGYITTNVGIGNTVANTKTTNSNWDNIVANCNGGDIFTITGVGGWGAPRLWAFVDSSNKLLGVAEGGANETDKVIIAPSLSKKIIVNFDKSQNSNYSLYIGENITDKVESKMVSECYYDEITATFARAYDSDEYYVTVPPMTQDGNVISFYVDVDTALSPMAYAQENGTNVTINCGMALLTTGGEYTQGNIISNGEVLNHNDIDPSEIVPNSVGYLSIGLNRTVKSYPIGTTLAELQSDGVTNCFTYYYPLIINGTTQNFNNITANESGVVLNRHPRMAIGVKSDNTIILYSCDGRSSLNKGMPSNAVASILSSLGCNNAWMLDGGGSTSLTYRGEKLNRNDDGDGTVDRLITVKLNVKKSSALPSITDIYGQIGAEKQRTIKQIMPLFKSAESERNEILSLIGLEKMHFGYGYIYMNGSTADVNNISESASYLHSVSNCSAGDVYIVTGKGTYAARVWAFLDASGNVLSKAESDLEYNKERVVAPTNASKFVAQASVSYPYFAYKKTTGVI